MTRRDFVRLAAAGCLGLPAASAFGESAGWAREQLAHFTGREVFDRIVAKASAENWVKLPIGQLIGRIAMELKGTPYVGHTLEVSTEAEYCVVNLEGLDCVTFFEDSLCMARMIKHGKHAPEDLAREIEFTRYRGGKMG